VSWTEAAAAYLLMANYTMLTHRTYKGHLKRAGLLLGKVPLGLLTAERLEAYRASVLGSRRGTKTQALAVPRVFLVWAAEHGLHEVPPATIREVLRPPGAARGIKPMGRTTRWRRERGAARPAAPAPSPLSAPSAPSAPATVSAFGYPSGVSGLALAAEEIQALREALIAADPERWGELVRSTDHPARRRPGGATAVALKALRAAADAADTRRGGTAVFLAGLGYDGPGGERQLLGALRDLRAAFAEQQRGTLGRTVWRLHWTEVPIPMPRGGEAKPV
jgi:hypothetical protein